MLTPCTCNIPIYGKDVLSTAYTPVDVIIPGRRANFYLLCYCPTDSSIITSLVLKIFIPSLPDTHLSSNKHTQSHSMAQTLTLDLDRKIAKNTHNLPAFLQRRIQFREASQREDKPTIVGYKRPSANLGSSKQVTQSSNKQHPTLSHEWESVQRVGGGLRNLGNTCFLNAVLQCLHYTPSLHYHLVRDHKRACVSQMTGDHCWLCEMSRVCKQLSMGACVPSGIVSRLKMVARHFKPGRQEDAHEFLRCFLDALFGSKNEDISKAIFGGSVASHIQCGKCGYVSITRDPVMDVSLDCAPTLQQAFKSYTRKEQLSKQNQYKCSKCNQASEATRWARFGQLPSVLVCHLKRFTNQGGKLDKSVEYPCELDLEELDDGVKVKYKLYAVVVHEGYSSHSGHYYSFVQASNHLWYLMNDERVHQVSLQTVLKQQRGAYMLFYRRVINDITDGHTDEEINVDESSDAESLPRSTSSVLWITSPMIQVGKHNAVSTNNKKQKTTSWTISKCNQ